MQAPSATLQQLMQTNMEKAVAAAARVRDAPRAVRAGEIQVDALIMFPLGFFWLGQRCFAAALGCGHHVFPVPARTSLPIPLLTLTNGAAADRRAHPLPPGLGLVLACLVGSVSGKRPAHTSSSLFREQETKPARPPNRWARYRCQG